MALVSEVSATTTDFPGSTEIEDDIPLLNTAWEPSKSRNNFNLTECIFGLEISETAPKIIGIF